MPRTSAFLAPAPLRFGTLLAGSLTASTPPRAPFAAPSRRVAMSPLDWLQGLVRPSATAIAPPAKHAVLGSPVAPPSGGWQKPLEVATFGMGCFWGAERKFWTEEGVYSTSVGYAGGRKVDPTYREVCSGRTGHAEVVNVVFDSSKTSYERMLDIFWESHDPTTRNRQGNDVGTQYRSAIYYFSDEQKRAAARTRDHFDGVLKEAGRNATTTEIEAAGEYYFAEEYHQQYLHKHPNGYCGLGGTGLYTPPARQ